jgi:hypothetical protein
MMQVVNVVFVKDYSADSGTEYAKHEQVALPLDQANSLVHRGVAEFSDPPLSALHTTNFKIEVVDSK